MTSDIDPAFGAYLQHQIRTTDSYLFNKSLLVQELMLYLIAGKLLCYHLNEMEIMQFDMPPPFWWEYIWCCSVLLPPLCKKIYGAVVILFGIAPMTYGFIYYLADWLRYTTTEDGTIGLLMWKGIPLVLLMNPIIIAIITLQAFSVYLQWNLHH